MMGLREIDFKWKGMGINHGLSIQKLELKATSPIHLKEYTNLTGFGNRFENDTCIYTILIEIQSPDGTNVCTTPASPKDRVSFPAQSDT